MRLWRSPAWSRRRSLLALTGIGLLAALVLTVRLHPGDGRTAVAHQAAAAAAGSGAGSAAEAPPRFGADNVSEGAVVLPAAAGQVNGYPVGFPHDQMGAVTAAVAVNRAQIGFDYAQADTVATLYATDADRRVIQTRARDAVAARRQRLGVPTTGTASAPAVFVLTPFAFTVRRLDTDFCAVTVLNLATTTHANGELRDFYYQGTQLLRWVADDTGGDWKLTAGSPEDREAVGSLPTLPAVPPADPRFKASGWVEITLRDTLPDTLPDTASSPVESRR